MIQAITTDAILGWGLTALSLLVLAGSALLLRPVRPARARVDMDRAVRKAPYHRLHNVLPPRKP